MDADEGLDHRENDEQRRQDFQVFPLRAEVQKPVVVVRRIVLYVYVYGGRGTQQTFIYLNIPKENCTAVKSPADPVKEEDYGEGDDGEGEAIERDRHHLGGHGVHRVIVRYEVTKVATQDDELVEVRGEDDGGDGHEYAGQHRDGRQKAGLKWDFAFCDCLRRLERPSCPATCSLQLERQTRRDARATACSFLKQRNCSAFYNKRFVCFDLLMHYKIKVSIRLHELYLPHAMSLLCSTKPTLT